MINIVSNTTDGKGIGVFYWEPDWISTQTFGSPWENLAMFDFSGELLTSVFGFDSTLTFIENVESTVTEFQLYQNYPNPFNPATKINWQSPVNSWQTLKVYDVLGNEVVTLVDEFREAGVYSEEFKVKYEVISSGIYFYRLSAGFFV